jgi:transposase
MPRQVLTDSIWNQLEETIKAYGCHRWKNDRNIMEAILLKLRTGAPCRDTPKELCPLKTAYNRFNR